MSAISGGMALIANVINEPSWTTHTGFHGLYFPGVILMAVVGGSSLIAALGVWKRAVGNSLMSISAGVIMIIWIIGEIVSIQGIHWLQIIYLATGLAVIVLTPTGQVD